jgi:hypothetical protein
LIQYVSIEHRCRTDGRLTRNDPEDISRLRAATQNNMRRGTHDEISRYLEYPDVVWTT